MNGTRFIRSMVVSMACLSLAGFWGCRTHMPHRWDSWPASGDQIPTHPKPPEGAYYKNWDPYAVELTLVPGEDVNPVRTQHVLIATVLDKEGKPLPNRRVEWIISEGSVGDIVEVDESGWRASRGYKVDNHFAVSHTNNGSHVLDRGNDDPSDDIHLEKGQTWCVITSPIEGDTYITAYAPGIYDWSKHKVFAVKHWYDVRWDCPPPASNPVGTSHEFVTRVAKYSDNSPLAGYAVTYTITDGPPAVLEPGGGSTATVTTDGQGHAAVTIRQTQPTGGTNNVSIEIVRPENVACCRPAVRIASCDTSKTWIPPEIGIRKTCTPNALVGDPVTYTIEVVNPSRVDATNVTVTDNIPDGISYVSSSPAASASGNSLTWSLGTLPGGGSTSITIQATASRLGTFENCAEVRADQGLQARDCCQTVVTAPALAIEKRCPAEVLQCDPIDYVVVVRNTGDGVARNVQITDTFPAGITTADGQTGMMSNVGDLGPGQSKEVRYQVRAATTGTFTNRVIASGDGGLTAEATCTTVVRKPELSVSKTGPAERYIGRPAEYRIVVTNNGDTAARDTVLTDTVPAGTQFSSASDGGQFGGGLVTWRLGTIEPGQSREVTVTLQATGAGMVRNIAKATANCAEGEAAKEMPIRGVPALLLEVIDLEDPDEVGTTEEYVITVTNQGTEVATNVQIVADIQPEAEYVSSAGATQGVAEARTVTFAPLPTLAPKAKAEWRVVVRAIAAGDTRFRVSMTSDQTAEGGPVVETESTHFYE